MKVFEGQKTWTHATLSSSSKYPISNNSNANGTHAHLPNFTLRLVTYFASKPILLACPFSLPNGWSESWRWQQIDMTLTTWIEMHHNEITTTIYVSVCCICIHLCMHVCMYWSGLSYTQCNSYEFTPCSIDDRGPILMVWAIRYDLLFLNCFPKVMILRPLAYALSGQKLDSLNNTNFLTILYIG